MSPVMKKFARWCVKYKPLAMLIVSTLLAAVIAVPLFLISAGGWTIFSFSLLFFLLGLLYVNSALNVLMFDAAKSIDEKCDPYPMIEESEFLLKCKLSDFNRQLVSMNYCVALHTIGEFDKVFAILSDINIDKSASMLPVYKFVYYNNLFSVCLKLDKHEAADIWYDKMCKIYGDMKENKQKRNLLVTMDVATAEKIFKNGDFVKTIQIINSTVPSNLYMTVTNSLLCAKAYLELGEKEKAAEKLRFVIDSGNKLYVVSEAKELLKKCEKSDTDWL